MKTNHLQKMVAVLAVTSMTLSGITAMAQSSSVATTVPPAAVSAPAPELFYGVPQILKLVQAKVSDDTIIAYIRNSGNGYPLNADQIIYLRQQGVSDAVLTVMLNQPRTGALPKPTTLAPVTSSAYAEQVPTATVAPQVTYVQSVPDTVYYSQPYYYYYYPSCAWYPPVTYYYYGWGRGWHGGWHGGWRGGGTVWGGNWHGGWHGSVPSGGWHGGGYGSGWHSAAPNGTGRGGVPSGGSRGNWHR